MAKTRFIAALMLAFATLASLTASLARAQAGAATVPNHPLFSDRFTFEIGAYYPRTSTTASLGPSSGGTGVVTDFEDTLGLDDRKLIGIAAFTWRMAERWRLDVDYFKLDRSATKTLGSRVDWGNEIFPPGSTVNTSFDFQDIRVSASYLFFKRPDKEVGVGLGLHVASLKASLESGTVGAESSSVTAPLPVVNFYGAFALTDEWAVRMRVDWLSLNYDIYSGDLRSIAVEAIYQPFRNFAFGFGLRNLVVDVDIDDSKWHGKVRTSYAGPAAFLRLSF